MVQPDEVLPVDSVASDGQHNDDSAAAAAHGTAVQANKLESAAEAAVELDMAPAGDDQQEQASEKDKQQQGVEQQGSPDYMDTEHDDILDYGDDYEEHEHPGEEPDQAIAQPLHSPGQATPDRAQQQPRLNTAVGAEEGELDMSQDGAASGKTRAATGAEEQGELVREDDDTQKEEEDGASGQKKQRINWSQWRKDAPRNPTTVRISSTFTKETSREAGAGASGSGKRSRSRSPNQGASSKQADKAPSSRDEQPRGEHSADRARSSAERKRSSAEREGPRSADRPRTSSKERPPGSAERRSSSRQRSPAAGSRQRTPVHDSSTSEPRPRSRGGDADPAPRSAELSKPSSSRPEPRSDNPASSSKGPGSDRPVKGVAADRPDSRGRDDSRARDDRAHKAPPPGVGRAEAAGSRPGPREVATSPPRRDGRPPAAGPRDSSYRPEPGLRGGSGRAAADFRPPAGRSPPRGRPASPFSSRGPPGYSGGPDRGGPRAAARSPPPARHSPPPGYRRPGSPGRQQGPMEAAGGRGRDYDARPPARGPPRGDFPPARDHPAARDFPPARDLPPPFDAPRRDGPPPMGRDYDRRPDYRPAGHPGDRPPPRQQYDEPRRPPDGFSREPGYPARRGSPPPGSRYPGPADRRVEPSPDAKRARHSEHDSPGSRPLGHAGLRPEQRFRQQEPYMQPAARDRGYREGAAGARDEHAPARGRDMREPAAGPRDERQPPHSRHPGGSGPAGPRPYGSGEDRPGQYDRPPPRERPYGDRAPEGDARVQYDRPARYDSRPGQPDRPPQHSRPDDRGTAYERDRPPGPAHAGYRPGDRDRDAGAGASVRPVPSRDRAGGNGSSYRHGPGEDRDREAGGAYRPGSDRESGRSSNFSTPADRERGPAGYRPGPDRDAGRGLAYREGDGRGARPGRDIGPPDAVYRPDRADRAAADLPVWPDDDRAYGAGTSARHGQTGRGQQYQQQGWEHDNGRQPGRVSRDPPGDHGRGDLGRPAAGGPGNGRGHRYSDHMDEDEDAATPLGASALPAPFNIRPFVQIHNEKLKVWWYKDPNGQEHGPCSISDFRGWLNYLTGPDYASELDKFRTVSVWQDGEEHRAIQLCRLIEQQDRAVGRAM